jgi:hypothetical protein
MNCFAGKGNSRSFTNWLHFDLAFLGGSVMVPTNKVGILE